ncbi:acyltransferase family protein [Marivivens marinus]|uniref:acyltransferase family protein n=1 Tax=Marivivens marinus TaxID=3110173 RepID=UPI003B847775
MTPILDDKAARNWIDLFRAVAILQVVLFHVLFGIIRFAPPEDLPGVVARLPGVLDFAWQAFGVDLVFLVSAFLLGVGLISERHAAGRIDLRNYYVRRVSRILPLYWFAVLFFGLAGGATALQILQSAAFVGYIVDDMNVVPVGWTMEVMMIVYILLPFAVAGLFRTKRPLFWIGVAFVASALARLGFIWASDNPFAWMLHDLYATRQPTDAGFELYFRLWFRLPPFIAGLGLAWGLVRHREWAMTFADRNALLLGLVGAVLCWVTAGIPAHDPTSWLGVVMPDAETPWRLYFGLAIPVFSIGAALLLWVGLARGWGASDRLARIARPFSVNIFGIYLFHMPLLAVGAILVFRGTDHELLGQATTGHVMATWIVTAIISLGVAALLMRLIERPALRLIRRKFG